MAMYLLNLSIDTDDLHTEFMTEDVYFNDQETIIELVVEKILGFEDAFNEYEDQESEDFSFKKNVKIDFIFYEKIDSKNNNSFFKKRKLLFADQTASVEKGKNSLDTPPPKI